MHRCRIATSTHSGWRRTNLVVFMSCISKRYCRWWLVLTWWMWSFHSTPYWCVHCYTEILCHLHRSPVFVLTSYFHGEKYVGAEVLATIVMSGSTDDPFHWELKNQVMPKNLTILHDNNSIYNVFNWNWREKLILAWKTDTKKLPRNSKFESNSNTEVTHIERKSVSSAATLAEKFETKAKRKQAPQRRKESKPHQKFAAENNKTTLKFCPKVFFLLKWINLSQICYSCAPISATA